MFPFVPGITTTHRRPKHEIPERCRASPVRGLGLLLFLHYESYCNYFTSDGFISERTPIQANIANPTNGNNRT